VRILDVTSPTASENKMTNISVVLSEVDAPQHLRCAAEGEVNPSHVERRTSVFRCLTTLSVAAAAAVCQHYAVKVRHLAYVIAAAMTASWVFVLAPAPLASAQPCPDVEVVFARGTTEAPGVGSTGEALVNSLWPRLGTKSIKVYPVNYPATLDFATSLDGVKDASAHIRSMTANCPDTRLVLGGFSQGAAVMGFVTANVIPDGAPSGTPNPMPPEVADHVAAVALFGRPNARFMNAINEPQIVIGPLYAGKTIDLCVPNDPICSTGLDFNAHNTYADAGFVDQAATFVTSRVSSAPTTADTPSATIIQAATTGNN
jgi:hypothetical protein